GSGQVSIFEFRISPAWIHPAIKHRSTTVVALSLVLTLVGCASAPSRFYTLSAAAETAKNSSDISVAVGPVSIPAVVDRPQIVISIGPNQVRLGQFHRLARTATEQFV